MDAAFSLTRLKLATEELTSSEEWKELNREFLVQLEQAEYLQSSGEQSVRFSSLSEQDKAAAVSKAVRSIQKTKAYRDLKIKVSDCVDMQFFYDPDKKDGLSGDIVKQASIACGHLLERWPDTVRHLRRYLNHPLPAELRPYAWRTRLRQLRGGSVDLTALCATKSGLSERSAEEKGLTQACEALLWSNPVFLELADSVGAQKASKGVAVLCHRSKPGRAFTDSDFISWIPFLYIRKEELCHHCHGADDTFVRLVGDIAEQCESFMALRPMTMFAVETSEASEASNKFAFRVEQLLKEQDPALCDFLAAMFTSHDDQQPFHAKLRTLIQPFVRRMFVGDLPMDVLCYIWDQCFIGMDIPHYQCLPYFTATWLILLREKLLACSLFNFLERTLIENSKCLTIFQFQKEIKNRFLPALIHALHTSEESTLPSVPSKKDQPVQKNISQISISQSEKEALSKRIVELESELQLKQRLLESAIAKNERGAARPSRSSSTHSTDASLFSSPMESTKKVQRSQGHLRHTSSNPGTAHALTASTSLNKQYAISTTTDRRPFLPTHLTTNDIQDIWIRIFQRYTSAANLMCHGEQPNTQR